LRKIIVEPYNPEWPCTFEKLRDFVLPVLADIIVTIEHVGSTSVPGLAAKPIIDMDVVVPTQAEIEPAVQRLATLGYVHQGDLGVPGREAFVAPADKPVHHLYVCTEANNEYRRHVLFRDHLRKHPEVAKRYGELKQKLAQIFQNDRVGYTDAKSEFVTEVLKRSGWK